MELTAIARVRSPFGSKFGVPRQSGLAEAVRSRLVFEPPFRSREALRGIEGFSHLWLIWGFSENVDRGWSPTVRPPRLGGNARVGVFASRSPFRPNPLGLSCVRLLGVDWDTPEGPVLRLGGADLLDGTPVYDIKPYVPHADCIEGAEGGFAAAVADDYMEVAAPQKLLERLPEDKRRGLLEALAQDPAPHYQDDPKRIYGFEYAGFEIKFRRMENLLILEDITDNNG